MNKIFMLGLSVLLEKAEKTKQAYIDQHIDEVLEVARNTPACEDLVGQYEDGLISSSEMIEKMIDPISILRLGT